MNIGIAPGILTFIIALVLTGLGYLAFGATAAFVIFLVYVVLYLVGLALR